MSYEGHVQVICKNGHYSTLDALTVMYYEDEYDCAVCHTPFAWKNHVDDTNCESVGVILNMEQFVIVPAKVEVCNLGHNHFVSEAIYRIPSKEETENARQFLGPDGIYHPLKDYEKVMKEYHYNSITVSSCSCDNCEQTGGTNDPNH